MPTYLSCFPLEVYFRLLNDFKIRSLSLIPLNSLLKVDHLQNFLEVSAKRGIRNQINKIQNQ